MLLLSSLTLLSLVVLFFARLEERGKAARQVVKFAFESPLFRWKKELQTELPNPILTFKVWLILHQSCHSRHKALLNTRMRSLFSYLLLKAYPQQNSILPKSVGRAWLVCAFICGLGIQLHVLVKDTQLVKRLSFTRTQRAFWAKEQMYSVQRQASQVYLQATPH